MLLGVLDARRSVNWWLVIKTNRFLVPSKYVPQTKLLFACLLSLASTAHKAHQQRQVARAARRMIIIGSREAQTDVIYFWKKGQFDLADLLATILCFFKTIQISFTPWGPPTLDIIIYFHRINSHHSSCRLVIILLSVAPTRFSWYKRYLIWTHNVKFLSAHMIRE